MYFIVKNYVTDFDKCNIGAKAVNWRLSSEFDIGSYRFNIAYTV
jgi:hypothetical protein